MAGLFLVAGIVTVIRVYNRKNSPDGAEDADDADPQDGTLCTQEEAEQAENTLMQEGALTQSMLGRADPEEKKVQAWMEALMMHDGNAKMKKLEGMKARRRRKVGDMVGISSPMAFRPDGTPMLSDQTETPQNDQRTIDELLEELGEIKTATNGPSGSKSVAKKKKGKNQKSARTGRDGEELSPRADADADGEVDANGEADGKADGSNDD